VGTDFLHYGRQCIEEDDVRAVVAALKSDFLTTGPAVNALERAFAQQVGAQYAVACTNGTAALHLAALTLDLQPDDCVIVPAVTFLATANAIRFVGAEVVFSDVDPTTGLMRPADLEAAIRRSPKPPKAVFPVHIGGPCCDLAEIAHVAARCSLEVIEDACHALGTSGHLGGVSFRIGDCQWSRMAVFSGHAVKTIAMGEGGIITLNDEALARRLGRLRNHGMTREPIEFSIGSQAFADDGTANRWYYEMSELGYNYRATDLQCALGLSQLRKLDRFVARRRDLVRRYEALFREAGINGIGLIPANNDFVVGWHLFRIFVDFSALGCDRQTLMRRLSEHGVGSQVHYIPIYRQPYYRQRYGDIRLPGAEAYYAGILSLPLYIGMRDADVDRVVTALASSVS
jgi:UDP-4-amino-4,6-dideoxy-N-acetyl-beta-L-altrosamine transaminase